MEEFKCLNKACGHIWQAQAGTTACSKCNSVYVEWLTFPKWEATALELSNTWKRVNNG